MHGLQANINHVLFYNTTLNVMATEIERKFLVINNDYKQQSSPEYYKQGFLSTEKSHIVRVRIANDIGYITIKGISRGASRSEYEYEIPVKDAAEMLDTLCHKPLIEKYRYKVQFSNHIWEIDEFLTDNAGLVIAEIELCDENEAFDMPDWIGEEVTDDARYYNSNLITNPFNKWHD